MKKNQKYKLYYIVASMLLALAIGFGFSHPVEYGQGAKADWQDPEARFNTGSNKTKQTTITWMAVDNLQATCEAESRKRGLGGFGYPVEACSFWVSNNCQIFTKSNATTMHSLGHETRHCFQGNFH